MPVSSVRRSTANVPSNADEPLAPGVTDPLSAVDFAAKLPPTVIGQTTRTLLWPACHVAVPPIATEVKNSTMSVDFMNILNKPSENGIAAWRRADEARRFGALAS